MQQIHSYEELKEILISQNRDKKDLEEIEQAYFYAKKVHEGQYRVSEEPASQWVREDAPEQNPARSEKHLHGERFMAGSCDDRIQRTMILALAIRHRMERPAISMEGGNSLWSSLARCRLPDL